MYKSLVFASTIMCIAIFAGIAQAATVTLDIDAIGGQWWGWAEVSGGSCGISSFRVDVTADAGVNITSSLNKSPKGYDPAWNGGEGAEFGFKLFRSNGTLGMEIQAGQATAYGDVNDPLQDDLVLQGIGQTAGSRCSVSWDAKVLVASGTYSVTTPGYIYVSTPDRFYFNLLQDMGASWYGPGHVIAATSVTGDSVWVPEPATMVLMGLGSAIVLATRRNRIK